MDISRRLEGALPSSPQGKLTQAQISDSFNVYLKDCLDINMSSINMHQNIKAFSRPQGPQGKVGRHAPGRLRWLLHGLSLLIMQFGITEGCPFIHCSLMKSRVITLLLIALLLHALWPVIRRRYCHLGSRPAVKDHRYSDDELQASITTFHPPPGLRTMIPLSRQSTSTRHLSVRTKLRNTPSCDNAPDVRNDAGSQLERDFDEAVYRGALPPTPSSVAERLRR